MLKVPTKYKNCGIKVYCTKCRRELTINNKCENGKSANTCPYKDKHKFKLIVHVPHTRNDRRCKLLDTMDFDIALVELVKFKQELEARNYNKMIVKKSEYNTRLLQLVTEHLDFISGVNTPPHLIRKRTKNHIEDCRRALERLCKCLRNHGYSLENFEIKNIGDIEVGLYHDYLINEQKLGKAAYNKHFRIINGFYSWMSLHKNISIPNPFQRVELTIVKKDNEIITKAEFLKLLEFTKYENGWDNKRGRNVFRSWLVNGFQLALETGLRREELVTLKWNQIVAIDEDIEVFVTNNMKVDKIATGETTGKNIRYIPITRSLKALLLELGYNQKKGLDLFVLDRPADMKLINVMDTLSKGFSHYIKLISTSKNLEFNNLRKTYITMVTNALGDKSKLFTGHSNDEVLMTHYLGQTFLSGNLHNFNIFGENKLGILPQIQKIPHSDSPLLGL